MKYKRITAWVMAVCLILTGTSFTEMQDIVEDAPVAVYEEPIIQEEPEIVEEPAIEVEEQIAEEVPSEEETEAEGDVIPEISEEDDDVIVEEDVVSNSETTVTLNRTSAIISRGDTGYRLSVAFGDGSDINADGTPRVVEFISSKPKVVSVSEDGVLQGIGYGSAAVTANVTYEGKTEQLTCVVNVKPAPSWVKIAPTNATLEIGKQETGAMKVSFPNGYGASCAFASSDESVASVDEFGLVTARGKGTAAITVTTFNGKKAVCSLTVWEPVATIEIEERSIKLGEGMQQTIVPRIQEYERDTLVWSSSDAEVADVDANGTVTAKKTGSAVITVTAETFGVSAQCAVEVCGGPELITTKASTLKLGKGNIIDLLESGFLVIEPEEAVTSIAIRSAKTGIAAVVENNSIKAMYPGTTKITVQTANGLTTEFNVQVFNLASSVKLDKTSVELGIGSREELKVSFGSNTYSTYKFTSSNPEVATVNPDTGVVTGRSAGSAVITCTCTTGNRSATCAVTVFDIPETIGVNSAELSGYVGKANMAVTGTYPAGTMCEFRYTVSSGNDVVSVNANTGALELLKEGTAKVVVTATNNPSAKAVCTIYVQPEPEALVLSTNSVTLGRSNTLNMFAEGMIALQPANAETDYAFKSSNTRIVTVSAAGVITAVNTGTANVTVTTMNGKTGTIAVKVLNYPSQMVVTPNALSLGEKDSATLSVTFNKNSYSTYTYTSSDPEVAAVNATTGEVTGIKAGTAVITCACTSGKKTATCRVTVYAIPETIGLRSEEIRGYVGKPNVSVAGTYPEGTMCGFRYAVAEGSDVVSVNANTGALELLKEGTAKVVVTATNNPSAKAVCTIYVQPEPEALVLSTNNIMLGRSNTLNMFAEGMIALQPANAETDYAFKSSNTRIVTVSAAGVITAVNTGTANVTVTTMNGKTGTIAVKVLNYPSQMVVTPNVLSLGEKDSATLNVTFNKNSYSTYTYTSSDPEVAAVNATTGEVTGIKAGTAVITCACTSGKKTATCRVTVYAIPETIGLRSEEIRGYVGKPNVSVAGTYPEGTMCGFRYAVAEGSDVVSVNAETGALELLKEGTAKVVATATNNPSAKAVCTIYVQPEPEALVLSTNNITLGRSNTLNVFAEGMIALQPANAETDYAFKSSNTRIVTVSAAGVITAVNTGTANVTVTTMNGKKGTIAVKVLNYPSQMVVTPNVLSLGEKDSATLSVTFNKNSYSTYTYTSSDPEVATVNATTGEVTGIKAGTAVITCACTSGKKTATCRVTVYAIPETIGLRSEEIRGYVGKPNVSVAGTYPEGTMCGFRYAVTAGSDVVSVNANTGALELLKEGTAKVVVTATNNPSAKAVCTVNVQPEPEALVLSTNSITLGRSNTLNMFAEGMIALQPANAETDYAFKSSNTRIVTVSAAGVITAVNTGTVNVTVTTMNGKTGTIAVKVLNYPSQMVVTPNVLSLGEKDSATLSVTFNKNSYCTYTFASSDPEVATVNATTGEVTGIKAGTAVITCACTSGKKTATCRVTVYAIPETIGLRSEEIRGYVGKPNVSVAGTYPEGTMCGFRYAVTAGSDVVSVNAETGALELLKEGTAKVVATATNNPSAKAICTIYVQPEPEALVLSTNNITLGRSNTLNMFAEGMIALQPANAETDYAFKSSNTRIVTVSAAGVITAVNTGTANVTVTTMNGKTGTIAVKVLNYPSQMVVTPNVLSLGEKDSATLRVTFNNNSYSTYTYTSSDPEVAIVNATTGEVTGIKAGTAVITCACTSGKKTATCRVTVYAIPETIGLRSEEIRGYVGKPNVLVAGTYPEGTMCGFRYAVAEGSDVVSVNANTGALELLKEGTAKVVVTATNNPSAKAVCTINVQPEPEALVLSTNNITLGRSNTLNMFAEGMIALQPANAETDYAFKSSNTRIVTVSAAGVITAVNTGTANVTVTTMNGKTGTIAVKVLNYPSQMVVTPNVLSLGEKDSATLNVTFNKNSYSTYTFTSSDPEVATVNATTGEVTGIKAGTAVITCACTSGKKTATCRVTVYAIPEMIGVRRELLKGYIGKKDLVVEGTYPEGTMCGFKYSVLEGKDIVTIDPNSGLVTPLKEGTAKIRVSATNNPAATADCVVNICEPPTELILNKASITMGKGNKLDLLSSGTVSVRPENAGVDYKFQSSSSAVLVSTEGVLTASRTGNATITVTTMNGKKGTIAVKVLDYPSKMTLSKTTLTLGVMSTETLTVTFGKNTGSLYTFVSSDPSVASVDPESGLVTAISAGEAVITCACVSGTKSVECKVTVIREPSSVDFDKTEYTLGMNETLQTTVTDDTGYCRVYTYHSSNPNVVRIDHNGMLRAVNVGTAEITVTAFNGVSNGQKCTVTVYPQPDYIVPESEKVTIGWGERVPLNFTTMPEGTFSSCTYLSSNPTVVSVSKDGIISGLKKGSAVVTITATNGVTAAVSVYVVAFAQLNHRIENMAHRGGGKATGVPENSVQAFSGAKALGADLVEMDIQVSKDGVVFVMHDTSLAVGVPLSGMDYATIKRRLPNVCTYEEALNALRPYGIGAMVEFKVAGIEEKAMQITEKCGMYDLVSYGSFNLGIIQKIKHMDPSVTTVYIMNKDNVLKGVLSSPDRSSYDYISVDYRLLNESNVAAMHLAGFKVVAWTLNNKSQMQQAIKLGVDSITTDYPGILYDLMEQR